MATRLIRTAPSGPLVEVVVPPLPVSGGAPILLWGASALQTTGDGLRFLWPGGYSPVAASAGYNGWVAPHDFSLSRITVRQNGGGVGAGSYTYQLRKNSAPTALALLGVPVTGSVASASSAPVDFAAGDELTLTVLLEGNATPPATTVIVAVS